MIPDESTRFSRFCTILFEHMKINRKQLFLALFEWTDSPSNYFSRTAFYPFISGTRPLPDIFEDAFQLTPGAFGKARASINAKFINRIENDKDLRENLITFVENEVGISHPIKKYLAEDCPDTATFYTCILYIVLTGNQQIPPLKHKENFEAFLLTNTPPPSTFFLGRDEELQKIKSTLSNYGICYIWGISGIGKSDVACKYVKLEKSNYKETIYIRFHQSIETSIAMLAQPASSESYTVEERFQMNSKLISSYGKDTLVILDNFDICAEDDPHFPWLIGCDFDLIITSRTKPIDIPNVHLTALSPSHAIELFNYHCDRDLSSITDEQIEIICDKLMYHTLVTILVAKAITHTELMPDEVISALEKSLASLPTETRLSLSKDATVKTELYSNFIAELFNFAHLNRPEKMLLCMIAVMPLDGVTNAQFLSYTGEKTLDVINKYVRLGYIERSRSKNISMHPLIADTCISSLTDVTKHAIKEVLSNFLFDVYAQKDFPSVEEQLIAVSICEVILQHQEYELTQEMIDLTSFFTKCGQYLHTVDTTDYVLSHPKNLGDNEKDYSLALSSYYKGLALIQLGDKKEAYRSLSNAITILGEKNNFSLHEAELFFNAVIEHAACESDPVLCIKKLQEIKIDKDCIPNDNYEMLLSRISFKIASTYLLLEDYAKAEAIFIESLNTRNRILGPESISSGLALGNIAYSFQKMGKYDLAIEYYEMGIRILSKHYPENHMNLIRMHLNCATAYNCSGNSPTTRMMAELHFDVATSSAQQVVVENRTEKKKKKKRIFDSFFEIPLMHLENQGISIEDFQNMRTHILPNNGPSLRTRISEFYETYHAHGDASIYMDDYIKRTKEELEKTEE